jgi:hypothetical protein
MDNSPWDVKTTYLGFSHGPQPASLSGKSSRKIPHGLSKARKLIFFYNLQSYQDFTFADPFFLAKFLPQPFSCIVLLSWSISLVSLFSHDLLSFSFPSLHWIWTVDLQDQSDINHWFSKFCTMTLSFYHHGPHQFTSRYDPCHRYTI